MELNELPTVIIPPSPVSKQQDGDKVSCAFGFVVVIGLFFLFLCIMGLVLYFGFWINLEQDVTSKLLIVGGRRGEVPTSTVELVSLSPPPLMTSKKCSTPKSYPIAIEGAVGQVVNETIIICGGCCPAKSECYRLSHLEWSPSPGLLHPRKHAASAVFGPNKNIWVVGGLDDDDDFVRPTEKLNTDTMEWEEGPELPEHVRGLARHCLVSFNETHTFVIGGTMLDDDDNEELSDLVWSYDWEKEEWGSHKEIRVKRRGHACTSQIMPNGHRQILVVGGVTTEGEPLDTVERYLPHISDSDDHKKANWKFLERLPYSVEGASFVDFNGKPILVGGSLDKMELLQFVGDHWTELKEKIQKPKKFGIAFVADQTVLHTCD